MRIKCPPLFPLLFLCFFVARVNAINFTVGVTEFYPPFVMKSANNRVYGFDISVMKRLCKAVNATCTFKIMPFYDLLPAIAENKIDMAISSLVITKKRLEAFHFTAPYMSSYGRYLTRGDNPTPVVNDEILVNHSIGVEEGTVYSDYIKNIHFKDVTIRQYKTKYEQIDALSRKKVDFVLTDNQNAIWFNNNMGQIVALAGKPFMVGEGLGIAVAKKNLKYLNTFNQALINFKKSPSYKELLDRYFFQPEQI